MSVASSNNKKRSRSSSEDATNSSFVKNVTSRVSGLLPASVTKWFSSTSSSSKANGSSQTADTTDSSSEDESLESPVTIQPPQKRKRFTSPAVYNNYTHQELSSNVEQKGGIPGRPTHSREADIESTPLRSELPNCTKKDTMFKLHSHNVLKITSSVAKKRMSLFNVPNKEEELKKANVKTTCNTVKDLRMPYFKPCLLGSPFYPGRTMYGGASSAYIDTPNIKQRKEITANESNSTDNTISHSTQRILDALETYSSPLSDAKRLPQYARNSGNHSLGRSNFSLGPATPSAKTSYKTMELQVPSLASLLKLKQKSSPMNTTSAARQIIASHSSTSDYVPYPTRPQTTYREQVDSPSSKSVTKIKARLSRPTRGTNKDSEIEMPTPVSFPNSGLDIDSSDLPKFSFGTSTAESTPKPIFTQLTTENKTKIRETTLHKPDIVTSSQAPYKFSSPVRLSSSPPESQIDATIPKFIFGSPDKSIDQVKKPKNSDYSCNVGPLKELENKVNSAKAKDWQCSDCWVFNKADIEKCVCCGGKKPSVDKSNSPYCSVCKLANCKPNSNKCVNCDEKRTKATENTNLKPQGHTSKWKCEDCWVINDESSKNCVCCGGNKPNKLFSAKTVTMAPTNSSELNCDDVWIKNKDSTEKCTTSHGAGSGLLNSIHKPSNKALTNIKSQKEKWECPTCLVPNDADKAKCICCEGERPGTAKESDVKSFNFGTTANTTFKFGIPKSVETLNTQLATTNETSKDKLETNINILPKKSFTFGLPSNKSENRTDIPGSKEESETNNNNLPKKTFTFSLPSNISEDQTDGREQSDKAPKSNCIFGITTADIPSGFVIPTKTTEQLKITIDQDQVALDLHSKKSVYQTYESPSKRTENADDAPKLNFTFGIPKASAAATIPHSGLVIEESKNTFDQYKEKPQEVPTVTLVLPNNQETPKSFPSMFTSTATSQTSSDKHTVLPSLASNAGFQVPNIFNSSAQKKNQSNTLTLQPAASVSVTSNALSTAPTLALSSTPAFSFGTAGFKPTPKLVNSPVTTTTSAITAVGFASTLSAPTNSSTFQKNDSTTTSSAAPLFSFGGSTQNSALEKPKFNFSSGTNNKAETSVLFQPPTENKFSFGAPTENKFSFSLVNNNVLGNNGLSTGNALGGGNNVLQTSSGGLFGAASQKENTYASKDNNASSNLFVSNTVTNTLQTPTPPTFTFGSSTPFNAITSTPMYGNTPQSPPNVFGVNQTANNNQSGGFVFGSQTQGNVFGSSNIGPMAAPAPAPTLNFGAMNQTANNNQSGGFVFGSQTQGPTAPAPTPTFNFGASTPQTTGVFGFGQQTQAGGFNPGAATGLATPQVQFNMGSAPNTAGRRVRKAVRRTTPR